MTSQLSSAERLLALISSKLQQQRLSHRQVERLWDLGHGVVGNLLRRRTSLRLDHLDLFARVLNVTPLALFAEAYGDAPDDKLTLPSHLAKPDELKALMREVLEELLNADPFPILLQTGKPQPPAP